MIVNKNNILDVTHGILTALCFVMVFVVYPFDPIVAGIVLGFGLWNVFEIIKPK